MAAWRRQDEPGTGGAGAPRPPSPPKSRLIAGRWSCTARACVFCVLLLYDFTLWVLYKGGCATELWLLCYCHLSDRVIQLQVSIQFTCAQEVRSIRLLVPPPPS